MDSMDIEQLADKITERLSKTILELPKEFKENIMKHYHLMPVQIPCEYPSGYYLIDIYVNSNGSLLFRLKGMNGELIKEWAMG